MKTKGLKGVLVNSSLWKTVLGEIELSVSHAAFLTWFTKTELVEQSPDGKVVISVPNVFAKQQFEVKFNKQIKQILKKNGVEANSITYTIGANKSPTKTPGSRNISDVKNPSQQPSLKPTSNGPKHGLNPRYTLDSFVVGSSNDLAYAASQSVVHQPGKKYNPVFIYGGVGLGKTHLIQAVGNEVIKTRPKARVLYINTEAFVNDFLNHVRTKRGGFADRYRNVDLLIVDDIQFIAGKERTQDEFFHTFNALHQANKQIIISSDKPPKDIPTLTARLKSRFEWGMSIDIQMPDFETRCAILETKAMISGVHLPRETAEFLAKNIKTNIRELEGVLNQLLAFCEMRGANPDIQTAENLLGNVRQTRPHHITAKQIVNKIAHHFDIEQSEILSPKRDKYIVVPRQIAMYLLRSELHLSFPKIARELGRKDHTTAIHSVEKIEKAIKLDFVVREHVANIREELYV